MTAVNGSFPFFWQCQKTLLCTVAFPEATLLFWLKNIKKLDICVNILLSNTSENIGKILTGLQLSFKSFLPFLCKRVTFVIFKQSGNKELKDLKELLMMVHKKSPKMTKFSLIILMGMFERCEALFLSNLSMSFFVSSMLTSISN